MDGLLFWEDKVVDVLVLSEGRADGGGGGGVGGFGGGCGGGGGANRGVERCYYCCSGEIWLTTHTSLAREASGSPSVESWSA